MSATKSNNTKIENDEIIKALVKKCVAGDIQSIREFFDIYCEDIYNFPIRVFHLDEDQASEFFLYAFEKLKNGKRFKSYKGKSRFRTWFFTVLRNLVIDWMRTIKEVHTISLQSKSGNDNSGITIIENMPDKRPELYASTSQLDDFKKFITQLSELPVETRTTLKLSYFYYLNLESDELSYLVQSFNKTEHELLEQLSILKNSLADKAIKVAKSIDKITSLFLNISELHIKLERMKKELDLNQGKGTRYQGPDQHELEKLQNLIDKKRSQREKLLEKEKRGNFIIRTAHKDISRLMNIPEGSVSVQLNRAAEKLSLGK